ncbi:MAG: YcaQ family DNA glycosylase, partial [Anaerolineae bacterium]|nr:YcaQ family DNA glycosylase [Anaerolineae bacterium]
MRLSLTAARYTMLAATGLSQPPQHPATKEDVLATIRRMGALQIDTIHVVARSPYLVLWSRLGDYRPAWLDEWLAEGALFEYWAHAACFLPIEDWPLYRRLMLDGVKGWDKARAWLDENRAVAEEVLAHIRANGHARSSAFDKPENHAGGWWNWKPAKIALEAYFNTGDVMIARRHNFQRVYDLRERILPDWDDALAPPLAEVERALALKAVRALGIATARW